MTPTQFNKLNRKHKLLVVHTKGIELAQEFTRYGDIKVMNCYALDKFFVEIVIHVAKQEVEEIEAFVDGERLDRYTHIGMRGILNEDPMFFSLVDCVANNLRIEFKNFTFNKELTMQLAKVINTLNANKLEPLFDEDIVYEEQKPLFTISSKLEVIGYLHILLKRLKNKNRRYFAELGYYKKDETKPCIIISIGSKENKIAIVMVNTTNNKINRIYYCTKATTLSKVKPTEYYPS